MRKRFHGRDTASEKALQGLPVVIHHDRPCSEILADFTRSLESYRTFRREAILDDPYSGSSIWKLVSSGALCRQERGRLPARSRLHCRFACPRARPRAPPSPLPLPHAPPSSLMSIADLVPSGVRRYRGAPTALTVFFSPFTVAEDDPRDGPRLPIGHDTASSQLRSLPLPP